MPPHRLFLNLFATVILLLNLDPDEGLCNGTRVIVRAFSYRVIDAEIATGIHKHKRVYIPRILLTSSESELPFILRRLQFVLYEIPILPIRETRGALNDYYTSLQEQLTTYFGQNVSVYHVQPDGNCLYRSL